MKKYFEALEDTEEDERDFIQEEIDKGDNGTKIQKAKNKVKLKEKDGKKYKYRIHTCYHDEQTNTPCTTEDTE